MTPEAPSGEVTRRVRHAFDAQAGALAEDALKLEEMRARRLLRLAEVPPDARVLDVGCGAGAVLAHLARQGTPCVGVDLSRAMLARARRTGARVLAAAAESLPFPTGTFRMVVSRTTLRHVPAPDAAVWEMRRVLEPGGLVVVEDAINHVLPETAALREEVERLRDGAHVRLLSVSALTGLLEEAGFEVEAVEVVTHEREVEEWLADSPASAEAKATLRRRLAEDVDAQRLGVHARREGGSVLFDERRALVRGVKR